MRREIFIITKKKTENSLLFTYILIGFYFHWFYLCRKLQNAFLRYQVGQHRGPLGSLIKRDKGIKRRRPRTRLVDNNNNYNTNLGPRKNDNRLTKYGNIKYGPTGHVCRHLFWKFWLLFSYYKTPKLYHAQWRPNYVIVQER